RLRAKTPGRHYDRPAGLRLPPLHWRWQGPGNTRSCVAPSQEVRELGLSCGVRSLQQVPWWDAERRARSALRAPHPARVRRLATRLSAFRFLAFFRSYISWLKAQIVRVSASTAGILWRRSVRRAKAFVVSLVHVT